MIEKAEYVNTTHPVGTDSNRWGDDTGHRIPYAVAEKKIFIVGIGFNFVQLFWRNRR